MIHALDIETEDTSEGWSRDVSADFATDLQRRTHLEGKELTGTLAEFVLTMRRLVAMALKKPR